MSSYTVEELVNKFDQRKLKSKRPSPYSIFIEVNGSEIFSKLKIEIGKKPGLFDVRIRFKQVWDSLPPNEKSKYESAAIRLGYILPQFKSNRINNFKNTINNKIAKIQNGIK